MAEPSGQLDDVVHQRVRLGILTICNEARRVEFAYLQAALELTAGNLSRHLQILEEAGLVVIDKTFVARRSKTWVAITRPGTKALEREIAALRAIVDRVEGATSAARTSELSVAGKERLLRPALGP